MSDQESISFSFAVVGQKGVGKSSILKRFFGKDWDSGSNGTRTIAYYWEQKSPINKYNKRINYRIWELSDEEEHQTMLEENYNEASVIILVYDLNDKESFNRVQNYYVKEILKINKEVKGK